MDRQTIKGLHLFRLNHWTENGVETPDVESIGFGTLDFPLFRYSPIGISETFGFPRKSYFRSPDGISTFKRLAFTALYAFSMNRILHLSCFRV